MEVTSAAILMLMVDREPAAGIVGATLDRSDAAGANWLCTD
jgi:hypothetical protein